MKHKAATGKSTADRPTTDRPTAESPEVLILGGTGKTGRRVADKLTARGVTIRAASRSGETRFDWNDRETWDPALDGVSAVYVTYAPDLAVPEAPSDIRELALRAFERGIERLVLLSGRGEEEAQRCERIVLNTNSAWTVVRASWFYQNFNEGYFLEPLRAGVLALPAGDVREPFIDAEDIADVVVAALSEEGHEGEIYEVTGPRLMTFAEVVDEIADTSDRELRYQQVPVDAFVRGMLEQQVPEEVVSLTRYLFETVLDGRNASVADGVQRALGRAPRDFAEYAQETVLTGVWAAPDKERSVDRSPRVEHARTMRRFFKEVVNGADPSSLDEIVHPDYVYRSPGEELRGTEGLRALLDGYRQAFPDLEVEIDDLLAADDSTVVSFTLTGTHRGDLLGISPTGRSVKIQGMVRSRFRAGRIAEEWEILDHMSLFEQLGVASAWMTEASGATS